MLLAAGVFQLSTSPEHGWACLRQALWHDMASTLPLALATRCVHMRLNRERAKDKPCRVHAAALLFCFKAATASWLTPDTPSYTRSDSAKYWLPQSAAHRIAQLDASQADCVHSLLSRPPSCTSTTSGSSRGGSSAQEAELMALARAVAPRTYLQLVGSRLLARWAQEVPALAQLPHVPPHAMVACLYTRPWAEAVRLVRAHDGGLLLEWLGSAGVTPTGCLWATWGLLAASGAASRPPAAASRLALAQTDVTHWGQCAPMQALQSLLEEPHGSAAALLPCPHPTRQLPMRGAVQRAYRRIYPTEGPAAAASVSPCPGECPGRVCFARSLARLSIVEAAKHAFPGLPPLANCIAASS